jgi:uncharacterized protein with PQ loop repeat
MKIRREGGASLSYPMLFIYLFGLVLWLVYGIALHAGAVIVANAASIVLVAVAIVMKAITTTERPGNFIQRSAPHSAAAIGAAE